MLRLDVYALYKALRDYGMAIAPEDMAYFDRMNTMPQVETLPALVDSPLTPDEQDKAEEQEEEKLEVDPEHEDGDATTRVVHPGVQARVDALIDEASKALPASPPKPEATVHGCTYCRTHA